MAASGREALAALDDEAFDVLITDIQMPDIDGFQLTAEVREREKTWGRRLAVIAMTAHAMRGVREDCLAAGMDDYVSKPIRDSELLAALDRASGGLPPEAPAPRRQPSGAPPTGAPDSPAPRWDEQAALARVGGNRAILADLIAAFIGDCDTQIEELESAVLAADWTRTQRAAHTVRGMVNFFDARGAARAAVRLEWSSEHGGGVGAGPALGCLTAESESLVAALGPHARLVDTRALTG